jgi:hypothetical protein
LLFDGFPLLPSAVFADPSGLLVGRDAIHAGRAFPERLELNPKRRIDDGVHRVTSFGTAQGKKRHPPSVEQSSLTSG